MAAGDFSCFLYAEFDILIPWQSLVAWAGDADTLASMGFQRSFYRVEYTPWNGQQASTDNEHPVCLEHYNKTVHVADGTHHQNFIQLPNSYCAVWIASKVQLTKFQASSAWHSQQEAPWGIREMAASGFHFVDVPPGFDTAGVVPYDVDSQLLTRDAAVWHVSNNYCGAHVSASSPDSIAGGCSVLIKDMLNGSIGQA